MLGHVELMSCPGPGAWRPLCQAPDLCGSVFPQPREALRNEVQLSVLPTALCGFHLKQCQDPVDTMAPLCYADPALYPGCPHRALGLGGCGLEGAAGAEPGDEPCPYPGLDAGQGQVQP